MIFQFKPLRIANGSGPGSRDFDVASLVSQPCLFVAVKPSARSSRSKEQRTSEILKRSERESWSRRALRTAVKTATTKTKISHSTSECSLSPELVSFSSHGSRDAQGRALLPKIQTPLIIILLLSEFLLLTTLVFYVLILK